MSPARPPVMITSVHHSGSSLLTRLLQENRNRLSGPQRPKTLFGSALEAGA